MWSAMVGLTGSFLRFAVCASPLSAATVAGPDAALRFELILNLPNRSRVALLTQHHLSNTTTDIDNALVCFTGGTGLLLGWGATLSGR